MTQGTSIVFDGWTHIEKRPLINVVACNSRGSMFLYVEDFFGVEKTGKEIANFLLKSSDEIGPINVLQVVIDNASNCKLTGNGDRKGIQTHILAPVCRTYLESNIQRLCCCFSMVEKYLH